MPEENFKKQTSEPVFPEESVLVIEKILEKYGLINEEEKGIEKFINSGVAQEKIEIFENLPGNKISKLVRNYGEKKISLEDLPILLGKELNVSGKEAEEIAKELEETLLIFIKQAPVEEIPAKEKKARPEIISEPEKKTEEPKISPGHDTYREPIK